MYKFTFLSAVLMVMSGIQDVGAKKIEIYPDGPDGAVYTIDTSTKEAVFNQLVNPFASKWKKEVVVPSKVKHEGVTYTVTSLGRSAFLSCPTKKVTLPKTLTKIGESAFEQMDNLKSLTIPSGVESIGSACFAFSSIETVNIPATVTVIGKQAFLQSKIKKVTFAKPKTGLILRAKVFENCGNLESLTFPEGMTSIGESAMENCKNLVSVVFPSTIKVIPQWCLLGCVKLTSVNIPRNVTSVGLGALRNTALTSVIFPPGVTSLGEGVLAYTPVKTVVLPPNITSIPVNAFDNCDYLSSIDIPAKVTSIGANAFRGCISLMKVSSSNPTPPVIGYDAFIQATYDGATLLLPQGAYDRYRVAAGWRDFRWFTSMDINDTEADGFDADKPVRFYDLNGHLMEADDASLLPPGIYVRRQGQKASKILVP